MTPPRLLLVAVVGGMTAAALMTFDFWHGLVGLFVIAVLVRDGRGAA